MDLSSSLCKRLPEVTSGRSGSNPRWFHRGAVGLVKLGTGIILTKIQQSNLVGHAIVRHHSLGETGKCSGKKKGKPWECVDATFCSLVLSKTLRKAAKMVERSRTFHLEHLGTKSHVPFWWPAIRWGYYPSGYHQLPLWRFRSQIGLPFQVSCRCACPKLPVKPSKSM